MRGSTIEYRMPLNSAYRAYGLYGSLQTDSLHFAGSSTKSCLVCRTRKRSNRCRGNPGDTRSISTNMIVKEGCQAFAISRSAACASGSCGLIACKNVDSPGSPTLANAVRAIPRPAHRPRARLVNEVYDRPDVGTLLYKRVWATPTTRLEPDSCKNTTMRHDPL